MIALAALMLLLSFPAVAGTVVVKSGEHADFTRLVMELDRPTEWQLFRQEGGYELRLSRDDVAFDLSRVFYFIPRTRLTALEAVPDPPRLLLSLAEGTYAKPFEIRPATIVIDIFTGVAPAPILEATPQSPGNLTPFPSTAERLAPIRREPIADPHMDLYWRNTKIEPSLTAETSIATARTADEPTSLKPANPRVSEAEKFLLFQLGRAALQGIVNIELPNPPSVNSPLATNSPQGGVRDALSPLDHIAINAQTVFDRDSVHFGSASAPVNPVGLACPPSSIFAVRDWSSELHPIIQIGELNRKLLGEFDKPSPDAVLALAQLYIALGLGLEAVSLFDAFGVEPANAAILRAMAAIVDGEPVTPPGQLGQMADCETDAALWAVLALETLRPGDAVNLGAVLRAFSALPLTLRRLLGPALSEKLLESGATAAARSVRDAIWRAPGDHGTAMDMIEAQISISHGDFGSAIARLKKIIASNSPEAPQAALIYLETALDQGISLDTPFVETLAALAFERRAAPDGLDLARAHILAAGSTGLFDRAFDSLRTFSLIAPTEIREKTTQTLLKQLLAAQNDADFLKYYFAHKDLFAALAWHAPSRESLAERLLNLGFTDELNFVMSGESPPSNRGRILQARAALVDRNGAQAIAALADMSSPEAELLRGEALSLLQDHLDAQRAFLRAGAPQKAAQEAWRAGAWSSLDGDATMAQQQLLAVLGTIEPISDQAEPSASNPQQQETEILTATQEALRESQAIRNALAMLLAESPM